MRFEEKLQLYRQETNHFLQQWYYRFSDEPQKKLFDAMLYSLLPGGKRIRAVLCYEFCRMCGGDYRKATHFAAAVEMIHTYSLIHDDLPCMDDDDLRRGRPTNHKVFGEAMAVLAGDALLTDAFTVAAAVELQDLEAYRLAISVLSECAGSLGMVGGQVLDIDSENRLLTEDKVLQIQTRKTGALINAACVLGVIAGGGNQEQIQAAAQFAAGLGMAFQIRDDMLDVIGTEESMGKGVGTDGKKNTLVRLNGLEVCDAIVKNLTNNALSALDCFEDSAFLRELAIQLTSRIN